MTEAEIIVKMRKALDVLKDKYLEAEGGWAIVEFFGAANNPEHWMNAVVEAEELSAPYMESAG